MKYLISTSLYCLFILAFNTTLYSQTVCNYSIDCFPSDGIPDCECFNEHTQTNTAITNGDLRVSVMLDAIPYSCCGNSNSGTIYYTLKQTTGATLYSSGIPSGVDVYTFDHYIDCIAEGDEVIAEFYGINGIFSINFEIVDTPTNSNDAEPNNELEDAINIGPGSPQQGTLEYGLYQIDDVDYYRLVCPENGSLVIDASFETQGWCSLKTTENTNTTMHTNTNTGQSALLIKDCVAAGDTFYIEVSDFQGVCTGYTVSYDIAPPTYTNDAEPNNDISEAIPMALVGGLTGHIFYGGHDLADYSDFYRIIAPADGRIEVGAYFDNVGTAALLNSTGGTVGTDSNDDNDVAFINRDCIAEGDVLYLKVGRYFSSCTSYETFYNFYPAIFSNDAEPNNTQAEASMASVNTTVQGHIGYGVHPNDDDFDYHKIICPTNGTLQVTSTSSNPISLQIRNSNDNVVSVNNPIDCIGAGDIFFIRVGEHQELCTEYELTINFYPTAYAEDIEPNDDFVTASTILPGITHEGHLYHGYYNTDPGDYYKLTSPHSGQLEISIDFPISGIARLYNSNNTLLETITATTPETVTFLISDADSGDCFYLRLNEYNYTCSSYALHYDMVQSQNLNLNPIPSGVYCTGVYIVTTSGTVEAGANVELRAIQEVSMEPGFEVKLNGEFLGEIGDCPPGGN